MKRFLAAGFILALAAVFSGGPAVAQGGTAIVAGPDAQTVGYATPAMVAVQGAPLDYIGSDIIAHNVVSKEIGPNDKSWCVLFPAGECPLFWSELSSIGIQTVKGIENGVPGTIYHFYCFPHPFSMQGTLVLLPKA